MADHLTKIKKMSDDYNSLITIPFCNCGVQCVSLMVAQKLVQDQ